MADPVEQLRSGIAAGSAAAVTAALDAGVDPNMRLGPEFDARWTALHEACSRGHPACAEALLAAEANPNIHSADGDAPLAAAACETPGNGRHAACVAALLAAGADPALVGPEGDIALHWAALSNHAAAVPLLLKAAPQTALWPAGRMTPVEQAIVYESFDAARCLLELGALPSARGLLVTMQKARRGHLGVEVLPLYTPLAARQTLTTADWALVPAPCTGLGAALPAVQRRSAEEAAQLVRRLPAADRERLRTVALCLERVQRQRRVSLPAEIVGCLLALSVAE